MEVRCSRVIRQATARPFVFGAKCVDATDRVGVVLRGRLADPESAIDMLAAYVFGGTPAANR